MELGPRGWDDGDSQGQTWPGTQRLVSALLTPTSPEKNWFGFVFGYMIPWRASWGSGSGSGRDRLAPVWGTRVREGRSGFGFGKGKGVSDTSQWRASTGSGSGQAEAGVSEGDQGGRFESGFVFG